VTRPAIRLHIDRVVLDGVLLTPIEARAFQEALIAELTAGLSPIAVHQAIRCGGPAAVREAEPASVDPGTGPLASGVARSVVQRTVHR
jgi:hypothetical protein